MRADVTGDGQDEMFIASFLNASKSQLSWAVFSENSQGSVSQFAEPLMMFMAGAWSPQDGVGMRSMGAGDRQARRGPPDEARNLPIYTYKFDFPQIEKTAEEFPEEKATAIFDKNAEHRPKVDAILLSDFLEGRNTWSELEQ